MPEIPAADKEIGDAGHTDDHNLITLALVNHEDRMVLVEADVAQMLTATEGFTVTLDNTEHFHFFYVELPAGDRSGQPDIFGVQKSGTFVLRADGDGRLHLRSTSSGANSTPLNVMGHTSQTANLSEWRDGSNTLLAYVDPSGNIQAPNITPGAMNNITLSGGNTWVGAPSQALRPVYWLNGSYTEMRGAVTPSSGNFSFASGGIQLGSIPSSAGPPYGHQTVCAASGGGSGIGWVRVQIEAPNSGACRIMAYAPAEYQFGTIYLDNTRIYRAS